MPDHALLPSPYPRSYTATPGPSGTQLTRHKTVSGFAQKLYITVRIDEIAESIESRPRAKLKRGLRPNWSKGYYKEETRSQRS
jgi:hypothetical protein